jgi:hypothetical protein
MVQPKYSPEEALQRAKLMMKYDTSKTLNENKEIIKEQLEGPAAIGAAGGAAAGVGAMAAGAGTLGAGAVGTGAMAVGAAFPGVAAGSGAALALGGAVIGGAIGLGLLPLVYWYATKDTGANKVKKMFEMCSSEATKIAKLPRKLQDTDLRSISDDIEDAIINDSYGFRGGTDEEKLFGAFKQLEGATASDFCALVAYYNKNSDSGDLFDDLDSDIDAESEWKQIFRPIRNCVEDSLLTLKDEGEKKEEGGGKKEGGSKVGGGYKSCSGAYSKGCQAEAIKTVQGCLGLVQDGKFGPKTEAALKAKGFSSFTDAEVDKICNKTPTTPVNPDEEDVDAVDPNQI